MDFFEHLSRPDLPRVEHSHVRRATGFVDRLLSGYVSLFNDRLRPMKPIALVNGMAAYDLTQPPMGSEPGARVLRNGFEFVVLKREPRPINMVLMVNSACNMSCAHCSARTYLKSGRPNLTFEEVRSVIDQFLDLGGASFILSGGEPTLHPRLLDIVAHVDKSRCVVAMFTNGTRLPELADELKSAGLFGTLVSIDSADPDHHDRLRGLPGAFDKAVAGIEKLLARGMLAGISTYVSRRGLDGGAFESILELGTRLAVHQLFVFDAVPTGALIDNKDVILGPDGRSRLRELIKAQNAASTGPAIMGQSWVNSCEGFGCFAGFYQIYVNAAGDVMPCDFTPITFGNVREEPLAVIWKRIRDSQDWGVRFHECRMQDPEFRRRTIDLLPPGTELPVPYEVVRRLRRDKLGE
jgi:MoaA/NifB/PqqE/SkfB family radical SAM enzyme